jgi:hypothetical protein
MMEIENKLINDDCLNILRKISSYSKTCKTFKENFFRLYR